MNNTKKGYYKNTSMGSIRSRDGVTYTIRTKVRGIPTKVSRIKAPTKGQLMLYTLFN